ncbi:MAG: acyltransferase family protein [Prevotella sp.]|nr:acyltransferase family protein [Prevotella sp.]
MPESNKTIQRQTNYELLRIIAILLISLMHGIRSAYGSPNILNSVSFVAINAIGNMGVTIFILISGYFGIRFRLSKLFTLWAIVLF